MSGRQRIAVLIRRREGEERPSSLEMLRLLALGCLAALGHSADDDSCLTCASEILRDNWAATSFPTMPKGLEFNDACGNNPTSIGSGQNCPSSSCMVYAFPFQGQMAFVRGCYSDFLTFDSNVTRTLASQTCSYGTPNGNVTVKYTKPGGGFESAEGKSVFLLCSTLDCNGVFQPNENFFNNKDPAFKTCNQIPKKSCVECQRVGSTGSCSSTATTTCSGSVCTKYDGYLGDEWFEVRGCAGVSPFTRDQCSWVDRDVGVKLQEVSIPKQYQGTHCFCSTEKCNPAHRLSPLFISLLLPFCSFLLSLLSP